MIALLCRLVTVDVSSPSPKWTDLVPEHERDVLESALALKGDHLIVRYEEGGEGPPNRDRLGVEVTR